MLIFLLGFMGSGKSFWGPQWARSLGMDFIDLDRLIEQREGMSVDDIFSQKGEQAFRLMESEVLRQVKDSENLLMACGGGTPCHSGNMEWMLDKGITVYLSATPRQLYERILQEPGKRPLLRNLNEGEILYFIEKTLQARLPFYSRANITLQVQDLDEHSWKKIQKI